RYPAVLRANGNRRLSAVSAQFAGDRPELLFAARGCRGPSLQSWQAIVGIRTSGFYFLSALVVSTGETAWWLDCESENGHVLSECALSPAAHRAGARIRGLC